MITALLNHFSPDMLLLLLLLLFCSSCCCCCGGGGDVYGTYVTISRSLTFFLKNGHELPGLYFHDGGTTGLLQALQRYLYLEK